MIFSFEIVQNKLHDMIKLMNMGGEGRDSQVIISNVEVVSVSVSFSKIVYDVKSDLKVIFIFVYY